MDGHIQAKRWRIINIMAFLRATMPFLQCKPSMLRGISPTNNEITKYKVCLNLHGRKQQYGVHYYETYSPVVTWFAVKIMITCSIHFGWSFCQVDFIQAYSQAPIEYEALSHIMAIPKIMLFNSWQTHIAKSKVAEYEMDKCLRDWLNRN